MVPLWQFACFSPSTGEDAHDVPIVCFLIGKLWLVLLIPKSSLYIKDILPRSYKYNFLFGYLFVYTHTLVFPCHLDDQPRTIRSVQLPKHNVPTSPRFRAQAHMRSCLVLRVPMEESNPKPTTGQRLVRAWHVELGLLLLVRFQEPGPSILGGGDGGRQAGGSFLSSVIRYIALS